ncbi:ANTAR domain-containing protein [Streptomyces albipurpureus]|uniref:ANTAR domain-containing protein n=1 Tax=Streptomyces albipurpureus TaxID=2897419 RepID=A0ABT0UQA9_9ACTN|nr:ANTAR domain-containing protein [Streptomyces sp. CWNU-1]MCM2390644.1 ANTAR domain-containing protein [Streptomyces sp. CWNU-1]
MAPEAARHRQGSERMGGMASAPAHAMNPLAVTECAGGRDTERDVGLSADQLREEIAGLRKAMASHPIIDMARGIMMATASCTPEEAWQMLVQVSQRSNVKLRDVARHIVASTHGPQPPSPVRAALRAVYTARAGRGG